jgi:hypothetical protein
VTETCRILDGERVETRGAHGAALSTGGEVVLRSTTDLHEEPVDEKGEPSVVKRLGEFVTRTEGYYGLLFLAV